MKYTIVLFFTLITNCFGQKQFEVFFDFNQDVPNKKSTETLITFLAENKNPTEEEIREAMHGNICRCASYNRIEKAVKVASQKMS